MSLGDIINSFENADEFVANSGKGLLEDAKSWASNLWNDVSVAIDSTFNGDVVGINVNKIPQMKQAIESYVKKVQAHLEKIKTETKTANAMQGEYAEAVKSYVGTACDVCYKITSHLRYFEDKLTAVQNAYTKKDEKMAGTINKSASEMNSKWDEYKTKS